MRKFYVEGGEPQIKAYRKEIQKAMEMNRIVIIKFFQLKVNMTVTQIEYKLQEQVPINLDISTHFGAVNRSLAPADFIMNVCWGWGKLSYSQIAYPDLVLYAYPDGIWEFRSGKQSFRMLQDWDSVSEQIKEVHHSILFDILKADNPGAA